MQAEEAQTGVAPRDASRMIFARWWTWVAPLVGAAVVFVAVLWTTPPGFGALVSVAFGTPRGPSADAAAYVLGSAASLALLTLVVLAILSVGIECGLRLRKRG